MVKTHTSRSLYHTIDSIISFYHFSLFIFFIFLLLYPQTKNQSIPSAVPLFNIYTSDIPKLPKNTTLTTYADDMNPAATHYNYLKAQEALQPYLEEIYSWTKK